jgi:phosphoglycerate dehydrogenase-like enzyme
MNLTIWCDQKFGDAAEQRLREGTAGHRLIIPAEAKESGGSSAGLIAGLDQADIAVGQPPADACMRFDRLRWVEVTSAGYTRYDTPEFRERLKARGALMTNTSSVFADPCAQHALAMMLALGRQLPASMRDQLVDQSWDYTARRFGATLLTGQTVLMLGYGAIARRLAELLQPFRCKIYALRRQARSEPGVHMIGPEDLTRVLPLADHVVNMMPANEETKGWVNARRLSCLRPGARFYNIGRGTTVDQNALIEALRTGRLGAAYLDVTDPEPLPPDHPLWKAPNCYITPHIAGGRWDQNLALVEHFLSNLADFEADRPLLDRVV